MAADQKFTKDRPKMAIVSTYDELCGIAAYTKYLVPQLSQVFDIQVFELDQYLLRSDESRVKKIANEHIKTIAAELKKFDVVNIQLEHGTIGRSTSDIGRRFKYLVDAAPKLSVTFHTMTGTEGLDVGDWLSEVLAFQWIRSSERFIAWWDDLRLTKLTVGLLAKAQKSKPVSVIVHTRRDSRHMTYINGIKNVFDHPLSFLSGDLVGQIKASANRMQFAALRKLPQEAVLIGVFGFLGKYKGFDTAIRALQWLPPNNHLLIFGGVHPNEIRRHEQISPTVNALLETIAKVTQAERSGRKMISTGKTAAGAKEIGRDEDAEFAIDEKLSSAALELVDDVSDRVHFMGALDDANFVRAMAVTDVVVMPYLEVGQSSSGPMSQALELGCRVIASRTKAFMQFDRYHPGRLEFFDIGNHVELATRIQAAPSLADTSHSLQRTVETNIETYVAANSIDMSLRCSSQNP